MKRTVIFLVLIGTVAFSACLGTFNRPLPVEKEQISVDFGAAYLPQISNFFNTYAGTNTFLLLPTGVTVRYGIADDLEFNTSVAILKGSISFKYNIMGAIMEEESPFIFSLQGGLSALLWTLPLIDVGALIGYNIGNTMMIYGGVLGNYEPQSSLILLTAIGGIEFNPTGIFGFLIEGSYSYATSSSSSSLYDLGGLSSIYLGFRFGGYTQQKKSNRSNDDEEDEDFYEDEDLPKRRSGEV